MNVKASVAAASMDPRKVLNDEVSRAQTRRRNLEIERPFGPRDGQWGLALSGGGIRSATFCLGVLQGMAKTASPSPTPPADKPDASPPLHSVGTALLPQFDYLSTVSGGGYIGGFFSSLFVKGRLNKAMHDDGETARQAYRVFTEEPPERLRSEVTFDPERPGLAALAWLRENGRYMAPSGAGDMLYAWAVHLRNWFGTHYVVGGVLFTALSLLALLKLAVSSGLASIGFAFVAEHERSLLAAAWASNELGWKFIWWSTLWWLLLPCLALGQVAPGVAFWLSHPKQPERLTDKPDPLSRAAGLSLALGIALVLVGGIALCPFLRDFLRLEAATVSPWRNAAMTVCAVGAGALLGFVWYYFTARRKDTISELRVALTRHFMTGLIVVLLVATVAVVDTAAQTIYLQWTSLWKLLTPAGIGGALIWAVRKATSLGGEKGGPSWIAKVPLETFAGALGFVLAFLVALTWAIAIQWLLWNGSEPSAQSILAPERVSGGLVVAAAMTVIGLGTVVVSGMFPGFLNLSTLQGLYSSRLTRAYLGASNSVRFEPGKDAQRKRSVAEPIAGDHIALKDLYANVLAPMHIINVCLNLTSDPGENLVQRDRKGQPLAIVPSGLWLDRGAYAMPNQAVASETDAPLTVGEWIGVSGAAFTTGLGQGTSVGLSLLMGLTNIRLGRWWRTGIRADHIEPRKRDTGIRWYFSTQRYLLCEFLARFYGTRRARQYLSDGGHFENTAVYELLRPGRKVSLIVCCDCGADPEYKFDDLANLARLARIDHGLELEVDMDAACDEDLGKVFGTFSDFQAGAGKPIDGKCAVLVKVSGRRLPGETARPHAHIVVLKPRILENSSIDLRNYQAQHPSFPQQPTSDQFFDEAQWESYRRLGREIAARVFPSPQDESRYAEAFRAHLLK